MTLNAHEIANQRHLKRHISMWRIIAVVAIFATIIAVASTTQISDPRILSGKHIAKVNIEGVIYKDDLLVHQIKEIADNDDVKGLIVEIDSPGGTVTGSEDLYLAIQKVAKKKPVAAHMRSVAASGGYISAIGADQIFASSNTVTGSIGVIFQWPEMVELFEKVGIKMQTVKSAPLKAAPSPNTKLTEAERAQTQLMVEDSFNWFKQIVKERRKMSDDEVQAVSDGRVFSGRQAIDLKLIDAIGDESDAKKWIESEVGDDNEFEIVNWNPVRFEEQSIAQFLKITTNELVGAPIFDIIGSKTKETYGLMAIMRH